MKCACASRRSFSQPAKFEATSCTAESARALSELRIHSGKKVCDSECVAAKVMVSAFRRATSSASSRPTRTRRSTSSATGRKLSPAGVSVIVWVERSNSGVPSHSSSDLMRRLSAGWVTCRRWAARENPPSSAMARKSSSQTRSMMRFRPQIIPIRH
ncbi:hypothetical protein BJS_08855 [Bradyrhizobium japonicum SEMIA 5079]|nr:hypothetical protein BJS_08855 [Bradyrhizobium japonicum SEMIA 5079]